MNARKRWSQILIIFGYICMLVGAIDPLEGSLLIFPGSGLVTLGTFLGQYKRRLIVYKISVFILITIGVGAMWGISVAGGIGGSSGHSYWWGVLVLPYLIGWSMGIWGPDSPRWVLWLCIVVCLWYLVLAVMIYTPSGTQNKDYVVSIILAVLSLTTISGCIHRLSRKSVKMKDYEKQIVEALLRHAGLEYLIELIFNTTDEDYKYTGHGYYLTVKNPDLPAWYRVLDTPYISGQTDGVEEVGFLAHMENNKFILECHGYSEGIPKDFRERQIEITIHT
ncbi:MAG: hypothetical protein JXA96_16850 [Sedimentisphaerales bacterium]|nr:hypothetical protein [Sedimentisphaerales bacterium]